jgi:regulator of RNase E activity RraA
MSEPFRPNRSLFETAGSTIRQARISTCTIADVLDGLGVSAAVLHSGLTRVAGGTGLFFGQALPVRWAPVRKGTSITAASPSTWQQVRDFLVPEITNGRGLVYVAGGGPLITDAALAGGLSATYLSRVLGFEGAVLGGAIRDREVVGASGLPVVASGFVPSDTQGAYRVASVGQLCVIENVVVNSGDWILSDSNGTVVVASELLPEVLRRASEIEATEQAILRRIEAGERLPDIIDHVGRI